MPNDIKKILNEFLETVKEILGTSLKKVMLYGSYARGDFKKNSDIDLLILTDLSNNEIYQYRNKIWEECADIEIDYGVSISPIIRNINSFEEWQDVKPFYINIIKEGVILVGEKN